MPLLVCVILLIMAGCTTQQENSGDKTQPETAALEAYFEAFNNQDIDELVSLSTDDIRMLSISSDTVKVDLRGRDELRNFMDRYFASTANVQSTYSKVTVEPPFVSFVETVSWGKEGEERKSQSSLATYKIKNEKVQRAWYFYSQ